MAPDPDRLAWFHDGEPYALEAVGRVADQALAGPSRLRDWSRAHVIAHLARNADALRNLLRWARTGEPSPMYASAEQRVDGIESTSRLSPDELRRDLHIAFDQLAVDVDDMPLDAWDAEILTARGRTVPASEVVWMRARETWVHAVDLDVGAAFADQPRGFVAALLTEIASGPGAATADPPMRVTAVDLERSWILGHGEAVDVSGPAAAVLMWISGRGHGTDLDTTDPSGHPPEPPPWL